MTAIAKRDAPGLPALADQIRYEHEACEDDARSSLEHAIRAGELLIEAKERCDHGEWLPWLDEIEVPQKTANNYMRLAANQPALANLGVGSITKALAALAKPKPEPPPVPAEIVHTAKAADPRMPTLEAEVLYDPKEGGVVEEENYTPSPADPGDIQSVINVMELLLSSLELYSGMDDMAETLRGWIARLEMEMENEH